LIKKIFWILIYLFLACLKVNTTCIKLSFQRQNYLYKNWFFNGWKVVQARLSLFFFSCKFITSFSTHMDWIVRKIKFKAKTQIRKAIGIKYKHFFKKNERIKCNYQHKKTLFLIQYAERNTIVWNWETRCCHNLLV